MTPSRSTERRANLFAVGGLLAVVALVALLAYRPATVLGVDGDSLASSIGDGLDLSLSKGACKEADGEWRCDLRAQDSSGGGGVFVVSTRAFGCWDAVPPSRVGTQAGPTLSACINVFHLFFD